MEPFAAAIRNAPIIKGITVAGQCHKIGLFADNVILTLSDLNNSLPVVCKLIETFGTISYYKINISKCQVLTTNLNHTIRAKMKSVFPCNWDNSKIQYLGIYLTAKSNYLYESNYKKILQSVQTELTQLGKF